MSYVYELLPYYLCVLLIQAPGWLVLFGAVRLARRGGGRLRRIQVEGALFIVIGSLAKWIVYDPNFGIDRLSISRWSPWFTRAETGAFCIGVLLFVLGFFLDRRPRPGLTPFPKSGRIISKVAILTGILAGTVTYIWSQYPWFSLPWDKPRIFFCLGALPFAFFYLIFSKRDRSPAAEI
jgi:hypothetical protein